MASLFSGAQLDDGLWEGLEELLVSADVGVGTTTELLSRLKSRVRDESVTEPEGALELLKQEMVSILQVNGPPRPAASGNGPWVVLMVGVNGVGKTTSIAKLVQLYKDEGRQVLLGAADTYRAAAIDQLQAWGRRLDVDVIAHQPGADPGAVAFDAVQAATAREVDVVIIDTAGRLHTKSNLMAELTKIERVLSRQAGGLPQSTMLTLDATTGQNGLFQARFFTEVLTCDGVFLAKLDGTAKGGVVMAVAGELKLPVLYIGTGESPDDIAEFDPKGFVDALFRTG